MVTENIMTGDNWIEWAFDPLRPIAAVPLCNGPDPRMLELAGKDQWNDADWAYALMREAEGDDGRAPC